MAQINYKFIQDGDNKKINFTGEDGSELFPAISCDTDIDFSKLVTYLIKQIDTEQPLTHDLTTNEEYPLGPKEELIKVTIGQIIDKYNETVRRAEIEPVDEPEGEPEEDEDTTTDDQIPF